MKGSRTGASSDRPLPQQATYNSPMRAATETMLRNLAMLQAIPVHPRSKSTRHICEELSEINREYAVSTRTVQRSLDRLARFFPITCEVRGRANFWFWADKHALTQIPAMGESTAFVLRMAAEHLKPIMPPSALQRLEPYFRHAEDVLRGTSLGNWPDRAAIIGQGPTLVPPTIADDVQEAVCQALMDNRQIDVGYRSRSRSGSRRIVLNPLGVVVRAGLVYLVATARGYEDVRHFVLHRMSKPEVLETHAETPPEFSLSKHIRDDRQFSYPLNPGSLNLRAAFAPAAAIHLKENRLGRDHRVGETTDGRVLIEATVADTADLRWWLLGFGRAVEVLGPASLRTELGDEAAAMRAMYE